MWLILHKLKNYTKQKINNIKTSIYIIFINILCQTIPKLVNSSFHQNHFASCVLTSLGSSMNLLFKVTYTTFVYTYKGGVSQDIPQIPTAYIAFIKLQCFIIFKKWRWVEKIFVAAWMWMVLWRKWRGWED